MRNCHLRRRGMMRKGEESPAGLLVCKKWEREEIEGAKGGTEGREGCGRGQGDAYAASLYFAGLLQSPIPRRWPPASRVNLPHRRCRRALPPTRRPMPPSRWKFYESWNLVWRNERVGGRRRERNRELARCAVIFSGLSPPCLGCRFREFYGDTFDFLKGIRSDGYAGKWDTHVSRDAFRRHLIRS